MHQDPVFFSFIIPTYNRANFIGKTIDSLLKQQYNNYEIIVVDDGSTDNTEDVIKKYAAPNFTYIKKQNAERAATRNFGASIAKGEYVNFFDSDDLAYPNHLTEAINVINKNQYPEWFHLSFELSTPEGKIIQQMENNIAPTLNPKMYTGNILSCNGVFIRRDIALKNKFNEDRQLSASEDYELWCRLAARFPLYYSNTITSVVIDHDMRSMNKINGEPLLKRLNLLVDYLGDDKETVQYFGKNFNKIQMHAYSYIAVSLADQRKFKFISFQYLLKAFKRSTTIVTKKTFYATVKNLLLKW
ncbi:MAG TPA: glycosyltransferase family A protein [Ferruginibacter sp.]|jgi:glycosyltransferase involved in cell wall biosynthesis|nr:glycosyltransferase family A protein [Ferruginibacter sp.]